MASKRTEKQGGTGEIVTFDLDEHTYQIDPRRRKVYRSFVEIETARASQILSLWRAAAAGA